MSQSIRFTRSCPTCGRMLEIPVAMMGRAVACSHCTAEFRATAPQDRSTDEDHLLDEKIDRLLMVAENICFGDTGKPPLVVR
jgi:DNA-directed RNA polymerase subunit M/transcription elongation factor TFIIS